MQIGPGARVHGKNTNVPFHTLCEMNRLKQCARVRGSYEHDGLNAISSSGRGDSLPPTAAHPWEPFQFSMAQMNQSQIAVAVPGTQSTGSIAIMIF